jgi:hypothetical protein
MDKIHFGDCQWVLFKHEDTETPDGKPRPHFHIVANRVRITDGKAVSSWQDWRRSERALRELEQEFGLLPVQFSWETERSAPSTGQQRRYRREKTQYLAGERDSPPEKAVKSQIQNILDEITSTHPTLPELIERLQTANVLTYVGFTPTGLVKGIRYHYQGVFFSGTQLGKAYTFPGLQKYRGVSYDSNRDDNPIHELNDRSATDCSPTPELTPNLLDRSHSEFLDSKPPIDPEQKALAEQLYSHAWRLFQIAKRRGATKKMRPGIFCLKGENYALVRDETSDRFWVSHRERGELLLYKSRKLRSAQRIEPRDIKNFLQLERAQQHRQPTQFQSSEVEL